MLIQCQNESEWVKAVESELQAFASKKANVFLPAGETPKALYRKWRQGLPPAFQKFQFYQIDEIMDGENRFAKFFTDELPQVPVSQVIQFDVPGDVAILGLGLNGHVGFHEPAIDPKFYSGCVKLSGDSCERLHLKPGTWGLTFGLGAFARCQKVLLLVRGAAKQSVLEDVLKGDLRYPAAHLLRHRDFKVINLP